MEHFYIGCKKCPGPITTGKAGEHTHLVVTAIQYGARCAVLAQCTACGIVEEITHEVTQAAKVDFDALLSQQGK